MTIRQAIENPLNCSLSISVKRASSGMETVCTLVKDKLTSCLLISIFLLLTKGLLHSVYRPKCELKGAKNRLHNAWFQPFGLYLVLWAFSIVGDLIYGAYFTHLFFCFILISNRSIGIVLCFNSNPLISSIFCTITFSKRRETVCHVRGLIDVAFIRIESISESFLSSSQMSLLLWIALYSIHLQPSLDLVDLW